MQNQAADPSSITIVSGGFLVMIEGAGDGFVSVCILSGFPVACDCNLTPFWELLTVNIPNPIRASPIHPSRENFNIIDSCAIATLSGFDKSIPFILINPE
jgi:hypothetical protein